MPFATVPLLPDVSDRESRVYQLLAALQVLDVATTWTILGLYASGREANPIVARFIEHGGLTAAMLAVLVFKLATVWVLYEKQTGVKLASAIYSLVIVNNALVLGLLAFG